MRGQDDRPSGADLLGALMGRGRATELGAVELPESTSELTRELNLSAATVSVHLAILKGCKLVTSWRDARRVLYQRTPLAGGLLAATTRPRE